MTKRETAIAAMAECAMLAGGWSAGAEYDPGYRDRDYMRKAIQRCIIGQLRILYGANDPLVVHHLQIRGMP